MTSTKPTELEQIDDLIRWMVTLDATAAEVVEVLAEAGIHRAASTITQRAWRLGVQLSDGRQRQQTTTPLPMAMSLFPRLSPAAREQLANLADLADTPAGLTLAEYERAKARILGES